jgi:bifunctional UDP-N-acetylglucosamine pyrophosphorylase/glucosamine-1-phosphate N-acetyltransferase
MKADLPQIIDRGNWTAYAAPRVDPAQWTAVVAAAGKGTRLGLDRPKILYPVAGRSILEWLLDLLLPVCEKAVFVLSPSGRAVVERELERLAPGRYVVAIQDVPTGMGDAVAIGAACAATRHTAVVWGDQVALRPESIEAAMRVHQGSGEPDITMPTVFRPQPYIHFERDQEGRIAALRQAREGDAMPSVGESDTGFFCFRTALLRTILAEARSLSAARGNATAEFNLLPVVPLAVREGCRVLTPHLMISEETVGINSAADALQVEAFLRGIHG